MYTDGHVLGAGTTAGAAVISLPFTAGNTVFQTVMLATAAMATAVLIVRITKLIAINRTK